MTATLPLFVLHAGHAFAARLTRAVPASCAVHPVQSWHMLRGCLAGAPPLAKALVDPYEAGAGALLSPDLRPLLHDFPSIPVIAVVAVRPGRGEDICTLGRWGVRGIIDTEVDDTP